MRENISKSRDPQGYPGPGVALPPPPIGCPALSNDRVRGRMVFPPWASKKGGGASKGGVLGGENKAGEGAARDLRSLSPVGGGGIEQPKLLLRLRTK